MSLIKVTIIVSDDATPVLNKFFRSSQLDKQQSFISFFTSIIPQTPSTSLLEGNTVAAAVKMHESGCGTIDVSKIEDTLGDYMELDITEILFKLFPLAAGTYVPSAAAAEREVRAGAEDSEEDSEEDDELLVDEDGMPFETPARKQRGVWPHQKMRRRALWVAAAATRSAAARRLVTLTMSTTMRTLTRSTTMSTKKQPPPTMSTRSSRASCAATALCTRLTARSP
jgi:hypothetical protein